MRTDSDVKRALMARAKTLEPWRAHELRAYAPPDAATEDGIGVFGPFVSVELTTPASVRVLVDRDTPPHVAAKALRLIARRLVRRFGEEESEPDGVRELRRAA
jgi:hypothetical protein